MSTIRQLSHELQKIAIDELNEVPSRIPEDLDAIKQWLAKQSYLKSRTDDQFLISFLRGCKFSLERTKEKLDTYWTLKTIIPEFFRNRDPEDPLIRETVKLGISLPLPLVSETEPRIVMSRLGIMDPQKYTTPDIMKASLMIAELFLLESDASVILGHVVLCDLRGVGFGLLSQMTPQMIKKQTSTIEALPIRTKAIHFVNPPTGFDTLFKIFSSFLGEKIRSRLFLHESFDDLHKVIPKSVLPKEYGGEAGTVEEIAGSYRLYDGDEYQKIKKLILDGWYQKLLAKKEYFSEDSQYGTIESNRPGLPKTSSTLFGVDGSFRSLNID